MGKNVSANKSEMIVVYGAGLGAAFGAAAGALFDGLDIAYGISMGVAAGVALAIVFRSKIVELFDNPDNSPSAEEKE